MAVDTHGRTEVTVTLPDDMSPGIVIGKGGSRITALKRATNARIDAVRGTRDFRISGAPRQVAGGVDAVRDVVAQYVTKRFSSTRAGIIPQLSCPAIVLPRAGRLVPWSPTPDDSALELVVKSYAYGMHALDCTDVPDDLSAALDVCGAQLEEFVGTLADASCADREVEVALSLGRQVLLPRTFGDRLPTGGLYEAEDIEAWLGHRHKTRHDDTPINTRFAVALSHSQGSQALELAMGMGWTPTVRRTYYAVRVVDTAGRRRLSATLTLSDDGTLAVDASITDRVVHCVCPVVTGGAVDMRLRSMSRGEALPADAAALFDGITLRDDGTLAFDGMVSEHDLSMPVFVSSIRKKEVQLLEKGDTVLEIATVQEGNGASGPFVEVAFKLPPAVMRGSPEARLAAVKTMVGDAATFLEAMK